MSPHIMSTDRTRSTRRRRGLFVVVVVGLATAWLTAAAVGTALAGPRSRGMGAVVGSTATGLALSLLVLAGSDRYRWQRPARRLARQVDALAVDPAGGVDFQATPELAELTGALIDLADAYRARPTDAALPGFTRPGDSGTTGPSPAMTRSGLFESPSGSFDEIPILDPLQMGEYSSTDMVDRLDPKLFRWLDSSPAEQQFLGWPLAELRQRSFLEIVHPDDLTRVRDGLQTVLARGEVHGLLFRIRTAAGKTRAVVMNVGARYGPDRNVSHLRGHLSDVTAKVRSERERRLRNRELTQVNDQLRLINRELEELKERYRDLYQNAPTMYFSLDEHGRILECNDTLLNTLGFPRSALVGRSYEMILPDDRRLRFAQMLAEFFREGAIEYESRWVKADGGVIDVWIKGSAVRGRDGRFVHSRSVAQDVTARRRLESELKEKHERLARTNEELSRRNHEMDEFIHVVSHDLQEPLRTLDAFSDFLLRDYGDRFDAEGQEFVRYIVEASRRMRALIQDLLTLSRAGRVTGDLAPVSLDELVPIVRADLAELLRTRNGELRTAGPLPVVWGDRQRLGQLLTNLVANGLKYNDKPVPVVELGESPTDPADSAFLTLYVRDNGIGIDPRFHTKIFQLFRRLHTREEYDGTGAGLAICEKIVHAHGGRIWVESAPGQGATFSLTLQRAPIAEGETTAGPVAPS
jgi:PAS domain S-box-containing protein